MQAIDKNLKILIGIAIVFIIGISVYGISTQVEIERLTPASVSQILPIEKKATLIIDDGTESPQRFKMEVSAETTVFDLLKQTGVALEYTEYDIGIFIDAIGGIWNDRKEKKNWMYYINDERAKKGAGKQIVEPGDKIEWRYEKVSW